MSSCLKLTSLTDREKLHVNDGMPTDSLKLESYLERRGQVVLEEPELNGSFGVFQNWQHHNPEGRKSNMVATGFGEERELNLYSLKTGCIWGFGWSLVTSLSLTWGSARTDAPRPRRRCWSRRLSPASPPLALLHLWTLWKTEVKLVIWEFKRFQKKNEVSSR